MEFIKTKKSKIDIYYQLLRAGAYDRLLLRGSLHGKRVTLLGG